MKSLWIASWYPNRYSPLNGDFIQRMARAASPFCTLAVLSVVEGKVDRIEVEIRHEKFLEILVYIPSHISRRGVSLRIQAIRAMNYLKGYMWGIQVAKRYLGKPDVLHLHAIFPAGLFMLLYFYIYHTPYLVTEHWSGFSKGGGRSLKWYHLWIARLCAKSARFVLPVSNMLARDMRRLNIQGNYQVVPNVVDTEIFRPSNRKEESSCFRFLHISNLLDEVKNVSGILDCVSALAKERNDFRFDIIGDGPDRKSLSLRAKEYGLEQIVGFLGEVENEVVSQELQLGNCLIIFSNFETFSCVTLEALCTGIPVIATETMGASDWIKPGKGYLVQPGDKAGLIEAMKKAMDNREDFDPEFIRSEVAEQCSYGMVGRKIAAFYHEALGTTQPPAHE